MLLERKRYDTHKNEVHVQMVAKALEHRRIEVAAFVNEDPPDACIVPQLLAQSIVFVFVGISAPIA